MLVSAPSPFLAAGFNPLNFDPAAMGLSVITILGLLVILRLVAWKPMLAAIEQREKRIEDAIRKAEEDRAAAQKALADYQRTVAGVEAEVAALREKGRQDAEALRRELLGKASAEAGALTDKARRDIEAARAAAVDDVRREAVTLGLAVAGKVVGRSLDGADQRRLAEQVVSQVAASGGRR